MAPQSISKLRELIPQTSHLTCTSRWEIQNGSLLSAWGGACIKFLYSGSTLNIRFGSETQRKDRWNGGTRMLEVSVSGFQPDSKSTRKQSDESAQPDDAAIATTRRYHLDAHPGLVYSVPLHCDQETFVVEITLIDWASIVEIDSFQTDEVYITSISSLVWTFILILSSLQPLNPLSTQKNRFLFLSLVIPFLVVSRLRKRKIMGTLSLAVASMRFPSNQNKYLSVLPVAPSLISNWLPIPEQLSLDQLMMTLLQMTRHSAC